MEKQTKYNRLIVILSVTIPVVVALLFKVKLDIKLPIFLPPVYATINAATAILLVVGFWAIRNKHLSLHRLLMKTAIILSVIFLLMYVLYHMTSDSTPFGGQGLIRYVYFLLLISHILLSIVVIPFVLITYVRAITDDIDRHKKIARITLPLWLYVAVSGVLVYLLIAPYY